MPLTTCASERCRLNKTVATLVAQTRGTKFVSFQEVRLQELVRHVRLPRGLPDQVHGLTIPRAALPSVMQSREVPVGHIPRQLVLHMRGDLAGQLHPGDEVEVAGVCASVSISQRRMLAFSTVRSKRGPYVVATVGIGRCRFSCRCHRRASVPCALAY